MDKTSSIAIIGALFTFFGALLTTLISYFRERSEREKWKRTLEIEERRLEHEKMKWALELNNQREMEIHKVRLRVYPEIFASLEALSSYNFHKLVKKELVALADKLNTWGYSEAGLCMLPDTRVALFVLRDDIVNIDPKDINAKTFATRSSSRTKLIELMRRDLNQYWSEWIDMKPLFEINKERIQQYLNENDKRDASSRNLAK